MFKLLFIWMLFFGISLKADVHSPYTADEQFIREGRSIKVVLLMGNPLKLFISGKERARIDTSSLKVELRPKLGGLWQELKINDSGGYYTVESTVDQQPVKVFEVKTTLKNNKSEVFKFKIP